MANETSYSRAIALTAASIVLGTLALFADTHIAVSGGTFSVCRQADVLDFIARKVRDADTYAEILRPSATEVHPSGDNGHFCNISVKTWLFDVRRPGPYPHPVLFWQPYVVNVVPSIQRGFRITMLPTPCRTATCPLPWAPPHGSTSAACCRSGGPISLWP
jgi:hypothetical protein